MRVAVICAMCLWLHVPCNISLTQRPSLQDAYDRGLQLKDEGRWQEALKTWWTARNELELRGESDPRIGVAFMELATEKAAKNYYGTASDIYLWGFSLRIPAECQSAVIEEAKRIIPLLETEEAKRWRELLSHDSPRLSHEIRLFWLMKDSRPSTRANERLIEHWQRIAYARKQFTKNHKSVYECDDRGTIYVKYGKPARKKSGFFGTSGYNWLLFDIQDARTRSDIEFFDPNPEYEVWLYDNIETSRTTPFIFSQRYGTGSFGLREAIELVASNRDYQLRYYADLSTFDEYFYDRLQDLRDWPIHFKIGRLMARTWPTYKFADVERSDFEKRTSLINILTRNVRILDADNRTRLLIVVVSSLRFSSESIKKDRKVIEIPAYRLRHTLVIWDQSLREVDRQIAAIPRNTDNVSIFEIEHTSSHAHYSISAEASPVRSDTLVAMGKLFSQIAPPLNADPDSLEISDLILGVEFPQEAHARHPRPIPLLPVQEFAKTDPMQVYLEVYHLKTDTDSYGHFTIEFSGHKLDEKGRMKKNEGEISLTFDRDLAGRTSKEYYSIDLSKLEPGNYELKVRIRDRVTAQEKTRQSRFRVLE